MYRVNMYDMILTLLSVILCFLCLPFVVPKCTLNKGQMYIRCQQDSTDTVPSFPQYNGTLLYLEFYGVWMIRNLDQSSFSDAPSVNQLKLQDIGLRYLSCDVFTDITRELAILNLDDNLLEYFPACAINNLWQLTELTLRGNFITCIPDHSIPGLLQILDVSDNRINTMGSAISTDVHNQNTLKTLIIRGNNFRRITNELNQFATLETLDISDNRLEWIDLGTFQLPEKYIQNINLSHNRLTGDVWKCLQSLTEVKYLNLSNNKIDKVDDGVISRMKALQRIDISHNMVSEVGLVFKEQQNLLLVSLHHNSITSVSGDIFSTGTGFSDSFNLDMSFNMLVSVEITISDCQDCTVSIHHNRLTRVSLHSNPTSTFSLIDMSSNAIRNIPADLPPWKNFDGAHNPFSTTSVLELLSNIHNPSVSSVNLQNTKFMCHQPPPVPDIYISSDIILHMQDNCVPSDFMCHFYSKSSSSPRVRIFLDRNGISSLAECPLNVSVVGLSLKGNQLNVLHGTYITQEMANIKYLDIAENNILMPDVQQLLAMYTLAHVNISNNNITEMSSITTRHRLAKFRDGFQIDFSSNNIESVNTITIRTGSMYNTHGLIDLSNNKLERVNNLIGISNTELYSSTFTLNVSHNHLEQIHSIFASSSRFGRGYHVTFIIDFSKNKIKNLTNAGICMVGLQRTKTLLNISYNVLADFPSCNFLDMCRYGGGNVKLDFSHNLLHTLPSNETCVIRMVSMLNVSHNLFTGISRPIANSSTLRYLTMNGNEIATITREAFIGLPNLIELDLSFNKLKVFPESVTLIKKLRKLNLAGNSILSVPDAGLSLWPSLSMLQLAGNPLVCSCTAAWLSNYTLTTDLVKCADPVGSVGNVAVCLETSTCKGNEKVYSSKENIQRCFGTGKVIVQNQYQTLIWNMSFPYVHTSPHTQTDIQVYRECKIVANVSAIVGNTYELSLARENDKGDQVCLTISDNVWIHTFTECLPLDLTTANSAVATTTVPSTYSSNTHPNNDKYLATIIVLSVLLLLCICGLVVCLVWRRTVRQGAAPCNTAREEQVYENDVTMETPFNSGRVGAEAADNYETLKKGDIESPRIYDVTMETPFNSGHVGDKADDNYEALNKRDIEQPKIYEDM